MANEGSITVDTNTAAPAAPAPPVVSAPVDSPAPAAPTGNPSEGRSGVPSYLNPATTQPAPAPATAPATATPPAPNGIAADVATTSPAAPSATPPAADNQPAPAAAPAAEATPSGFQVPASLTSFVDAAPPAEAAPTTEPAPAPTEKVTLAGNFKNDSARAISTYLAAGGDMEDVQIFQQAETLQKMSDGDLVVRDLMDKYNVLRSEAEAHLLNQYGQEVKDSEGNVKREAGGLSYKIAIENAASQIRNRIAGVVDKVNGAIQSAPTTGQEPAPAAPAGLGQQAQNNGATPEILHAASQAARDLLSANPTFDFPVKYQDGEAGTVKLGIPPEFADAAQQVLAASVVQARKAMKDNSPASIQQYNQNVQKAFSRVIRLFNDDGYQTVAAAAEQRGYERAKREAAGIQGSNIYGSRGTAPSGNGTTLTPKQQAIREAKHREASRR